MNARLVLCLASLVACDRRDDPQLPVPKPPPIGTETPPPTEPGPTPVEELTASCEVGENALRASCTVEVDPPQPVQVRLTVRGEERVHASDQARGEHTIPLYLLEAGTEYTFVAETMGDEPSSVTGTFTTGEPPEMVSAGKLYVTGTSSVPYLGTHLPCDGQPVAVIYDTRSGEVAWYGQLSDNGTLGFMDMVRFTEDHTVLGETGDRIVEMTLSGEVLLDLRYGTHYDEALHHDLFKRDGYVYAVFEDALGLPGLDGFLVFDRQGETVAEWRARDSLEIPANANGDFMHTNTIFVDDAGDVYLSSLTQNTVLAIAGDWTAEDFGELRWALAGSPPAGFGHDFQVDWSGVGDVGFRSQHAVSRLEDGRLMMLDNHHGRALVLSLDEAAGSATAEAEYAAVSSCGPQGTATTTSSGNVLVGCSEGPLREYTPDGTQVWEGFVECGGAPAIAARYYPLEGW